ncbi:uncharacterized protein LOC106528656 [Austrofundulus limnaeus]|uniref:Uncharacterized protein LOC106528656 n=1 Tax=Austrofundulus limnaeus TaxID=52670 RepID=A0A2I4CH65_AUSLI|nr:PREDICTED: uncharacterized protein LOC106528656 [Austrofundulus limnaeus]
MVDHQNQNQNSGSSSSCGLKVHAPATSFSSHSRSHKLLFSLPPIVRSRQTLSRQLRFSEMYSQYWDTARGRRPDHRRYTVVEGDTPLPLGSTCRRKRLRSVGEEDEEAQKGCRPNPEGSLSAGELSCYGRREEEVEEEEEQQRLCQHCLIMASQLSRQAAALTDSAEQKIGDCDRLCCLFCPRKMYLEKMLEHTFLCDWQSFWWNNEG